MGDAMNDDPEPTVELGVALFAIVAIPAVAVSIAMLVRLVVRL